MSNVPIAYLAYVSRIIAYLAYVVLMISVLETYILYARMFEHVQNIICRLRIAQRTPAYVSVFGTYTTYA